MHRKIITAVVLAAVAACERDYVYAPTVATSATIDGRPAALVRVPPEAPRGDVRIATFGIAGIRSTDDQETRALHVRMIVANNSDKPWIVDSREQRVDLPGAGESRPAYAASDGATPPSIEVPPGGKRSLDLFYPLPENLEKASKLPEFDLVWRVQTDARVVAERTPFTRLVIDPRPDPHYYAGWGYGWGGPYWYDPWYSRGAFVGVRPGYGYGYVDRPVVIEHRGRVSAPPANRVR